MVWQSKMGVGKKNYDFYNQQIGNRKLICDLGCGYGYFDYFLHYKNPERVITALDYDDEKIEIAANGYNKTNNLQFVQADVATYTVPQSDAIFLNDVLHYLTRKNNSTYWKNVLKHFHLMEFCSSETELPITVNTNSLNLLNICQQKFSDLTRKPMNCTFSAQIKSHHWQTNSI